MTAKSTSIPIDSMLFDAESVRELDRIAIEGAGVSRDDAIPGIVLMKRAARAVFAQLRSGWPAVRSLVVFCGVGNNGGDGYVIAGLAIQAGYDVQVIELAAEDSLIGDAARAREFAISSGVSPITVEQFQPLFESPTIFVDALLGTGFKGEPRPAFKQAIDAINRFRSAADPCVAVVSVDIPSGLEASTGRASSATVSADMTATFVGQKIGLYTGHGPDYCGRVVFESLGIPDDVYRDAPYAAEKLSLRRELAKLPARSATNHKGSHGHALIIGGERGLGGAALLSAMACARMGAGLVSVATDASNIPSFLTLQPELMVFDADDVEILQARIERASLIAIGPGLGTGAWGQRLLQLAIGSGKPLLLDADALNLVSQKRFEVTELPADLIMTPHPGEASRLLGIEVADIQSNRMAAVQSMVQRFGGVQLLKGAGTLIASSDVLSLNPYGNPGMGSGGMGDTLTGMIAGIWAQGLSANDAARLAACLHALAADKLAEEFGQRGLLAADLIPLARKLLNGLQI